MHLAPFMLNAKNNVCVEVLGTSFNVRSYSDENSVETVLEEGIVRMSQGKDAVVLKRDTKPLIVPRTDTNNNSQHGTVHGLEAWTIYIHG